ncbi:hypothetical protein AWV80_11505 [Cupriavidus sp. UYMU48A]|nr:hypothetical protein AWV80_11505 [Cupriavidus sp. UYMU48A]
MMRQRGEQQDRLFYSFHFDDYIPSNHLLQRDRISGIGTGGLAITTTATVPNGTTVSVIEQAAAEAALGLQKG